MEATVAVKTDGMSMNELIKSLIISEVDLGYDKRQNILMSCSNDGCNRISYCSCDCNDSSW
ncbi:MAG: hypothetical protein Q4C77_05960 [Eubacteriales bacterium]|nr:hypothetical protein [Eubacteriales bacterium]